MFINTGKPGHKGYLSLVENFYSPEDPNFKYLYETERACNGKISVLCCSVIGRFQCNLWREVKGKGPVWLQEVEAPRISRQSAHESGKVISPTHRSPLPSRR